MAEEFDRKGMPELLQTTFSVSLGACYKGLEMLKNPQESFNRALTEMTELFMIPEGDGLQQKAEAIAAVWMEKGAGLMEECRNAGEKLTDAK